VYKNHEIKQLGRMKENGATTWCPPYKQGCGAFDMGKRTVVLIAPWLKLKQSFLSSSHKFDTHIFHCAFD
jgi:hypothetical protein